MSTVQLDLPADAAGPERLRSWHTWHLHAGSFEPQLLEAIVTGVVGPAIVAVARQSTDATVRPWFFMRYWHQGPHVRFRIADLDDARAAEVTGQLGGAWATLSARTADAQRLETEDYLKSVSGIAAAGEGGGALDVGDLRAPGVYPAVYEPEFERYGGTELMSLSEDLFRVSSLVSLRAIALRNGRQRSFADGVESMAAMVSAWPGDRLALLTAIRRSWTEFLQQAFPQVVDTVEPIATSRALALREAADAIRALVDGSPSRWTPLTGPLRLATEAWIDRLGERRARGILTSHVHMTQNRLGVGAGQEAHISATLLKLLA